MGRYVYELTTFTMEKGKRTDDLEEFEAVDPEEGFDADLEDVEAESMDKIKKLQRKLKECEAEKMKHLEDLQRAKAEFLNSRKMLDEQLTRDRERITEKHVLALLPLADSFDMAMKDPAWQQADSAWKEGIERIYAQLKNILAQNRVESFDPLGEEFNPHEHEAVINSGNGNTIGDVLQKGYRRDGTIIRPAMVAVGSRE